VWGQIHFQDQENEITIKEGQKYQSLDLGNGCGGKYIFYSLGNFIFDQEWSRETKEGLTLKIEVSKIKNQNELQGTKIPAKLESVELIPVIIENYSTPRIATEVEAKRILDRIGQTETVLK
jgi:poly-gamma-glutamate synthesis protein (capsule biosynthesis protein)